MNDPAKRLSVEYLDAYLVVVVAAIALLIGAPAAGYAIGAGAWDSADFRLGSARD